MELKTLEHCSEAIWLISPINKFMKIIYSQLKQFLPSLKKTPREVANDLTMLGHFNDSFEKKEGEVIFGLEVKQNRGDCLNYYGIAKELAVLYDIPLVTPKITLPVSKNDYQLPIKIEARNQTKRIMALKISNLKNSSSPKWLRDFLNFHEINPINLLVDLTNCIMLWYGIPCHAFDIQKSTDKLSWRLNNGRYQKFTTLDGTDINLQKNTFLIASPKGVESLTMIGGQKCAIDLKTKEVLIEMAIYDPIKVRKDFKNLNIVTDAGIRLEKELDPELIPQAFSHLIELVLKNCQGEITSQIYDQYLQRPEKSIIKFDPRKISGYAGISFSEKEALAILKRLGCQIEKKQNTYFVKPPSLRKDLNLKEDLIEEAIRFHGYDKIPTNKPISFKKLPEITPKILNLIEALGKILVSQGYDEIRSWPLIQEKYFRKNKELDPKSNPVRTENSINSDFPVLRQSIISSLLFQKKQYQKCRLPEMKFFEIGKVFYQKSGKYFEHYSLAIYSPDEKKLKKDLCFIFKSLGIKEKDFLIEKGFFEVNLEKLLDQAYKIPRPELKTKTTRPVELAKQIISLDANVVLREKKNPKGLIEKYSKKIGDKRLWQLIITDLYQESKTKKFKYTFRAYYYNLDDKTAKKIHLKAFGLT